MNESTQKQDGGPAFPTPSNDVGAPFLTGMSLRDWFAGIALQGITASPSTKASAKLEDVAKASYEAADAMLKERSQSTQGERE